MADTKITDLSEKATGAATEEFVINDVAGGNVDKKIGMDGLRITESQITDLGSYLLNVVEDLSPQLGADLDANGFDINLDAGFLLTFDTGTQAQKIVGDAGGLTHTVPNADTHDFVVDATTVLSLAETGVTLTGTLDVSGILDTLDIETATVSARDGSLAITIADSTGISTFVTGAVLVAPVLGTPASGTMTNVTGTSGITGLGTQTQDMEFNGLNIQTIGVLTLKEQAEADADVGGEGQLWVDLATPNKLFFTDDAGTDFDLQSPSTTFTDAVHTHLEVPEGAIAFPNIHALATGSTKISGMVLPDGASTSTINFKCHVPRDVAATPAMKIRIRIMTLAADTAHAVRLTVSTIGLAVNEDHDVSLTAETEITAEMPDGTETGNEAIIEVDLTTDWAADDTVLGQLKRDPTDAVDDYAGDILVTGIELLVDRTIS